jgi:integrase
MDAWDKKGKIGSATAMINEALKVIGGIAKIKVPLTFHLARHSFAYNAMKINVPIGIIKNAMGHSSIKTTEMYLGAFNDDEINEALKSLYK